MKDRIRKIIEYKTGGNQAEFAGVMGWQPQYITRLLKGESIGLNTVTTILNNYPDINPSWLLLGVGDMVNGGVKQTVKSNIIEHVQMLLELEMHLETMTPQELHIINMTLEKASKAIAEIKK